MEGQSPGTASKPVPEAPNSPPPLQVPVVWVEAFHRLDDGVASTDTPSVLARRYGGDGNEAHALLNQPGGFLGARPRAA